MKDFIYLICAFVVIGCGKVDKSSLLPVDFRQFRGTQAEKLAEAVENEDTAEIIHQIRDLKIDVNSKTEGKELTLLMLSVYHDKLNSTRCLLELGADPNIYTNRTKHEGETAVYIACEYERIRPQTLDLLMRYGGDPNSMQTGVRRNNAGNYVTADNFALAKAASNSLEKVKILVNNGADVNKTHPGTNTSALVTAMIKDEMAIAEYLLVKGADYTQKFHFGGYIGNDIHLDTDILYLLRLQSFELDSEKYASKMRIVKFLRNKGLDYWKTPIPDRMVREIKRLYPNEWEDYLKVY